MSQYEVFSNPNLLSYLSKYLRHSSCTITQEGTTYYLHSSDIDYLCSPNRGKSKSLYKGLLSVVTLLSPGAGVSVYNEMMCVDGLLLILNGCLRLKYREYDGLKRVSSRDVQSGTLGNIKRGQGMEVVHYFVMRGNIQSPPELYRDADKQPPTLRKLWYIARRTPPVARALFHYAHQEDVAKNVRKVIEEIMANTYTGKGKVNFPGWNNQKWTEPEVGQSKMEEFWRWLHNSYMSGDKALHSEALSNKQQVVTLKAGGPIMLQQEALDITRTLLMKWIAQK